MVVSYLPDVMPDVASFARLFDTTGWNAEYQLTPAAIRDLQLFSARGKDGFYRRHGFSIRPDAAPGMEIKRSGSGFGDRP